MPAKKVTFPHMGDYYYAFKPLAELIGEPMIAPPITKKTIELGFKYSPESVCIPFKYNLGNYIEALEAGADVLIQAGGGCRFGHYAETQEEILRKLGYKFEFSKLANDYGLVGFARDFKRINPETCYASIARGLALSLARIHCIDKIADKVRKNVGFEANNGEIEAIYQKFLKDIDKTHSVFGVFSLRNKYSKLIGAAKLDKPAHCLRVGIVGELYMLMEPFSNFYLEKKLAERNIEVHRHVTVSGILKEYFTGDFFIKQHVEESKPYLKHHLGSHGTESVACAHKMVKDGFDGIIHLKPFGCMPEISAISALNNISKNYKIPILYFSFDSQTSQAGIETRIEAFCDMLYMKKKARDTASTQAKLDKVATVK